MHLTLSAIRMTVDDLIDVYWAVEMDFISILCWLRIHSQTATPFWPRQVVRMVGLSGYSR